MYTSFFRACLFIISFIIPLAVNAAGLGKLTINSALGQPLKAEIDLVSVSDTELSSLKANIASRDAFAQAGIQYAPVFSTFKISIEPRVSGEPYVKITSPQSVNEPFLNLLVELSWASGRLLREYTVLLDPVDTAKTPEPVAPTVSTIPDAVESDIDLTAPPPMPDEPEIATPVERVVETGQQPAPAPTQQAPGTYGPILEGDTLSSIARQVKPESVNVNQMLVALFRANREAFIADNMNLLKTGAILKIPGAQVLADISEKEANIEVRVQVSDWQKYRQNLAAAVQAPEEAETLKQVDTGEISTTVDTAAVTRSEAPEEVLRLSSGERLSDAQNGYSDLSTQERLRMMEEDAIARNLALKESNERVAMLEKNIENLQKLLALQNNDLAQAQLNAQGVQDLGSKEPSEIESIEVISSESVPAPEAEFDVLSGDDATVELETATIPANELGDVAGSIEATEHELEQIQPVMPTAPTQSVAAVDPAVNPILLPETEGASILDQVMENITYIGAGLAVLLLSVLAVMLRRRRKAADAEAAEEAKHEELSSALRNKTAAVVAAAHSGSSEKEDSEDFDKTNQFFAEESAPEKDYQTESNETTTSEGQENNLEQPFDSDQTIELDFSDENEKAEQKTDNDLIDETAIVDDMTEFAGNKSEDNSSLEELSQESSAHEIDFDAGFDGANPSAQEQAAEKKGETEDDHLMDFSDNEASASNEETDYGLRMDFGEPKETPGANDLEADLTDEKPALEPKAESESVSDTEHGLDFSVDPSTIDLSDDDEIKDSAKEGLENEMNLHSSEEPLEIDDEFGSSMKPDTDTDASKDEQESASGIDFSDINLDLEDSAETTKNQAGTEEKESADSILSESDMKSDQWHEVQTKIDLAQAYLDMDDKEGAKEMLEEVLQEGDAEQQKNAKEILEKL